MLGYAATSAGEEQKREGAGPGKSLADLALLVRSEYLESPGLHLTRQQAQRLWSLDATTCDAVLDALIDMRYLRRTHTGAYVRADVVGP